MPAWASLARTSSVDARADEHRARQRPSARRHLRRLQLSSRPYFPRCCRLCGHQCCPRLEPLPTPQPRYQPLLHPFFRPQAFQQGCPRVPRRRHPVLVVHRRKRRQRRHQQASQCPLVQPCHQRARLRVPRRRHQVLVADRRKRRQRLHQQASQCPLVQLCHRRARLRAPLRSHLDWCRRNRRRRRPQRLYPCLRPGPYLRQMDRSRHRRPHSRRRRRLRAPLRSHLVWCRRKRRRRRPQRPSLRLVSHSQRIRIYNGYVLPESHLMRAIPIALAVR